MHTIYYNKVLILASVYVTIHGENWFSASITNNKDKLQYKTDYSAVINVEQKFQNSYSNVNKILNSDLNKLKTKLNLGSQNKYTESTLKKSKDTNGDQRTKERFLDVFQVVQFDHIPCMSTSGLDGTCLPEHECERTGGTNMGSCADGYGTCCVTQFKCDGNSAAVIGWFTNPDFPSPSSERLSCVFTLNRSSKDVKQIRLDLYNFELLPPSGGLCQEDQFVVSGQNVNDYIPILCGINTGQHLYIEVGDSEGPIFFSMQTVSPNSRLFSIKVTQLKVDHDLAAPSGCLQYFKDVEGSLESFNYQDESKIAIATNPSYLNNLNYAICIKRAEGTCDVTYTNDEVMQILNYDTDGLPIIPRYQAGVEIFNCPSDWLLMSATRLCGDRLNDGSVIQDFSKNAPVTDTNAGPIVIWFRSDEGYVGRGFRLQYKQNPCTNDT